MPYSYTPLYPNSEKMEHTVVLICETVVLTLLSATTLGLKIVTSSKGYKEV